MKIRIYWWILAFLLLIAPAIAIPDGGVAYYDFNEGSGTTLIDQWNGYNGVIYGGMAYSTDYPFFNISGSGIPYSGSFDGIDDYVIISGDQFNKQNLSISLWIKILDSTSLQRIIEKDKSGGLSWTIELNEVSNGYLDARVYDSSISGYRSLLIDLSEINDGKWHFIVLTMGEGYAKLFLDGVEKDSSILGSIVYTTGYNTTIGSGYGASGATDFYNGYIDEVKIFNRVLTDEEIQNLYNYGSITPPAQPITILTRDIYTDELVLSNWTINNRMRTNGLVVLDKEDPSKNIAYGYEEQGIINGSVILHNDCINYSGLSICGRVEMNPNAELSGITFYNLSSWQPTGGTLLFRALIMLGDTTDVYEGIFTKKKLGELGGWHLSYHAGTTNEIVYTYERNSTTSRRYVVCSGIEKGKYVELTLLHEYDTGTLKYKCIDIETGTVLKEGTAISDYLKTPNEAWPIAPIRIGRIFDTNYYVFHGNITGLKAYYFPDKTITNVENDTYYDLYVNETKWVTNNDTVTLLVGEPYNVKVESTNYYTNITQLTGNETGTINISLTSSYLTINYERPINIGNYTITINTNHESSGIEKSYTINTNNKQADITIPLSYGNYSIWLETNDSVDTSRIINLYLTPKTNTTITVYQSAINATARIKYKDTPLEFNITLTRNGDSYTVESSNYTAIIMAWSGQKYNYTVNPNGAVVVTDSVTIPYIETSNTYGNLTIYPLTTTHWEKTLIFYAQNNETKTNINTFNVTLTSKTYGYTLTGSTTDGSLEINLNNEDYNVTIDATGYTLETINLSTNNITSYTFYLIPEYRVYIYFYREEDLQPVSGVTFTVSKEGWGQNYTATGNNISITVPGSGEYLIIYNKEGYRQRDFPFYIGYRSWARLNLYLINESSEKSLPVSITLYDIYGNRLKGYYLDIYRYYPEANGSYILIDTKKTDIEGVAYVYLEPNKPYYKMRARASILGKPLITVGTSGEDVPFQVFTSSYSLTVKEASTSQDSYDTYLNLYHVLNKTEIDNDTILYSYTYQDTTNLVTMACLEVREQTLLSNDLICKECLLSSAGTIHCYVNKTKYPKHVAKGVVYTNTEHSDYITDILENIEEEGKNILGINGLIIALVIALALAMMGISIRAELGIVGVVIGLMIGLMTGTYTITFGAILGMLALVVYILSKS